MSETPSAPVNATPVRIPAELRDWLKHEAIDNRRTLGNEIVFRLQESRARQGRGQPEPLVK